jgi:uncharacterized protein
MDRLEQLRQVIDEIVRQNPDFEETRCGFVHLYGVSATCTILALKRGLNLELCSAAGMLHDIWSYKAAYCPEHGPLGAIEAEKILKASGTFTPEEIDVICQAIARHSDKQAIDGDMDELLKDADVFQHFLYNPSQYLAYTEQRLTNPMQFQRLERVLAELRLSVGV